MPDIICKYLPTYRRMRVDFENGDDFVLRKSTALLLIYTPKKSRFGCEDANFRENVRH